MGSNYLAIPKLQRLHRWSLGMAKWFHPTLYWVCDYLSMLGLKVILGIQYASYHDSSYFFLISRHHHICQIYFFFINFVSILPFINPHLILSQGYTTNRRNRDYWELRYTSRLAIDNDRCAVVKCVILVRQGVISVNNDAARGHGWKGTTKKGHCRKVRRSTARRNLIVPYHIIQKQYKPCYF